MIALLRILCCSLCLLSLPACSDENYSPDYLINHPKALRAAFDRCQAAKTPPTPAQCNLIFNTAAQFSTLLADQQTAPETFGDKIMQTELAMTQTQQSLQKAQENYQSLQTKQTSASDLQKAKDQLDQLEKTYQAQQQTIRESLAVIGLGSPD